VIKTAWCALAIALFSVTCGIISSLAWWAWLLNALTIGIASGIIIANYALTIGTPYKSVADWENRVYKPTMRNR
jgi:hypothetical protein